MPPAAQPLRILALLEANSITGTAKAVIEFAREARAHNHAGPIEIAVANFTRGDELMQNALTRTLAHENIPLHWIRERGRFDRSVIPRLRQLAAEQKPHVIWSNSVKSHFLVHWSGLARERKWAAFHHGYTSTDLKMRAYNLLDRFSLPKAGLTLTVCQPFAAQLIERGVPADRIRVQHMPIRPFEIVPEQAWQVRASLNIAPEAKVILSIGRLSQEKGHVDLIRAFSLLSNGQTRNGIHRKNALTLLLVGDGPERASLQQLAAASTPPGSVVFTGHRDDIPSFYGLADLFVLPSYTEGTPNVILEAMAAHVPVVSTNVGGIPELAMNGENALLVESANVSALRNAMDNLLTSPELGSKLAVAAEKVVANHSPGAYFRSLAAHFRKLAA